MLEKSLERSDVNCEIIAYTISPTTQTPATYPMLTPMFGEAETVAEWRGTDNNKIESADHTKQPTGSTTFEMEQARSKIIFFRIS